MRIKEIIKKSSILLVILLATYFTLSMIINSYYNDLYFDEKNTLEISNHTVLSSVYVNGTKCIVMESNNHGAISCNWNRTYKDNL